MILLSEYYVEEDLVDAFMRDGRGFSTICIVCDLRSACMWGYSVALLCLVSNVIVEVYNRGLTYIKVNPSYNINSFF